MRYLWVTVFGLSAFCVRPARAADPTEATGVLDLLAVPPAPSAMVDDDRRRGQSLAADPIAVPTPTAGQFGLAVAAAAMAWCGARGLARRMGTSAE